MSDAPFGLKPVDSKTLPQMKVEEWTIDPDYEPLFLGDGLVRMDGKVTKGYIPYPEIPKTWNQHPRATHFFQGCLYLDAMGDKIRGNVWPGPPAGHGSFVTIYVTPFFSEGEEEKALETISDS